MGFESGPGPAVVAALVETCMAKYRIASVRCNFLDRIETAGHAKQQLPRGYTNPSAWNLLTRAVERCVFGKKADTLRVKVGAKRYKPPNNDNNAAKAIQKATGQKTKTQHQIKRKLSWRVLRCTTWRKTSLAARSLNPIFKVRMVR